MVKETGSATKSVVGEVYKGTKQVAEESGVAGAVRKAADTVNRVGGHTLDNFLKIQDAFTQLLTFFTDPKFLFLILAFFVGIVFIRR
mgnify:FL=1